MLLLTFREVYQCFQQCHVAPRVCTLVLLFMRCLCGKNYHEVPCIYIYNICMEQVNIIHLYYQQFFHSYQDSNDWQFVFVVCSLVPSPHPKREGLVCNCTWVTFHLEPTWNWLNCAWEWTLFFDLPAVISSLVRFFWSLEVRFDNKARSVNKSESYSSGQ